MTGKTDTQVKLELERRRRAARQKKTPVVRIKSGTRGVSPKGLKGRKKKEGAAEKALRESRARIASKKKVDTSRDSRRASSDLLNRMLKSGK